MEQSHQQTIDYLRSNLRRDRKSYQNAYKKFINTVPVTDFYTTNREDNSKSEENDSKNLADYNKTKSDLRNSKEDSTRELMFAAELNRRSNFRDSVRSPTPPPYGLPGLGEYEERRKKIQKQQKKDYINYLSERNANLRPTIKYNDRLMDYEELLAQKRREEYDYRHFTNDPLLMNGAVKASKSESNVNRIANFGMTDLATEQQFNSFPNYNDQIHPRPHSYPPEITFGLYNNSDSMRDFQQYGFPGSERRPGTDIHLFSYKTDNLSQRQPLSEKLSHRWKTEEEKRSDYQAELKRQMEEDREKRARMKEEEERLNRKIEEENRNYDPWGRDGGGAPRRDRHGKVIASRCQVNIPKSDIMEHEIGRFQNGDHLHNVNGQQIGKEEQIESQNKDRRSLKTDETETSYAIPRSPQIDRTAFLIQSERRTNDDYKDELKRQIEAKKLQQQMEKDKERLEDEKLARRIQEQQEKMQREYEEEQRKHRLREEERRRRNEDLQRRNEEQRKETNRRRRDVLDDERRKQFEAREKTVGKFQGKDDIAEKLIENSPPLPSIKTKQNAVQSEEIHRNSKDLSNSNNLKQPQPSASRTRILSQLTTMRQQLEKEQQHIQEQLKKQKSTNYEDFDSGKQNGYRSEEQVTDSASEANSLFERGIEREIGKEHTDKTSISSSTVYRPETLQTKRIETDRKVSEEIAHQESSVAPKSNSIRKILPATTLSLRSLDGYTPLQGESLFLGVEGYDLQPTSRWRPQNKTSRSSTLNDGSLDGDRLADQEAARRRYLQAVSSDPDEVNADSFLDEYLARNIRK